MPALSRSLAVTSSPPFFLTGITAPGPTKASRGISSIDLPLGTMWIGASTCVPAWQASDICVTLSGAPLSRLKHRPTWTSGRIGIFGIPLYITRERSTISTAISPFLSATSPQHIKRIFIHKGPFDSVVGQPELIQGFLNGPTDKILLVIGHGIPLHGERADFHVLFIHPHVKRPVANVFGVAVEAVLFGEAVDDSGHTLARRPFQTKPLAGIQLQPRPLIAEQLAPI